jgi:hypothetical protein
MSQIEKPHPKWSLQCVHCKDPLQQCIFCHKIVYMHYDKWNHSYMCSRHGAWTIASGCQGKFSNIRCHNCSTYLNFYKFMNDQRGQNARQANMWDKNVKMWRLLFTLLRGIVHGESNIGIIQMKCMLKGYLWKLVFFVNHHMNCRLLQLGLPHLLLTPFVLHQLHHP